MAKKYRKLQIKHDAYRVGDTATPERIKKIGGIDDRPIAYANNGRVALKRQQAKVECTLDAYRFRRTIDDNQYNAGMMFRWSYLKSARFIKVVDYQSISGCGGNAADAAESESQARIRVQEARENLTQPQYFVIEAVCGWDETAGNSNRMDTMKRALDNLYNLWFGGLHA